MPIVHVQMVRGRDEDVIAALALELTDLVEKRLGAGRDTIRVIIDEVEPSRWFKDGMSLAWHRAAKDRS